MLAEIILITCLLFATANGNGVEFSYDQQTVWTGVCVSGNTGRQSPINIVTADVRGNSRLTDLQLGDGWRTPITGTFKNGGNNQNVQFDPANRNNPAVTTTTYLGNYLILQMNMHWGANAEQGSEHTVNGRSYPLELHFVHTKVGESDTTAGDYISMIGVFAEVDDNMPVSGVWAQLNISAVQTYPSIIPITGFIYESLLPTSLDYYHYQGSLTTPPCNEIVQWFVLKDTIPVPGAFLDSLRQIQDDDNRTVTFNFRDPQLLRGRTVYTLGSGSPKIVASSLSIILLITMFITMYFS